MIELRKRKRSRWLNMALTLSGIAVILAGVSDNAPAPMLAGLAVIGVANLHWRYHLRRYYPRRPTPTSNKEQEQSA